MACTPFTSNIIADVGISMGDEGKGRLIYEVIQELKNLTNDPNPVKIVVKVNGGANSGHTAGGLKLNLLPAGVIDKSVNVLAIGSGVVADPRKFWWEIKPLENQNYPILSRLLIDERTQVSDLIHRMLDLAWEDYRLRTIPGGIRGSTGRGISPAFCDEVGQWQIYYSDFKGSKDDFADKLYQRIERGLKVIEHVCEISNTTWRSFFDILTKAETNANKSSIESGLFSTDEFEFCKFIGAKDFTLRTDLLINTYWESGTKLVNNIGDVRDTILAALIENKYIIGEFGQSFWLDKRHGFSPNVSASHTYSPEFFHSTGIPIQKIHTMGVCKAYDTKVGTHTFITQMPEQHPLSIKLKKIEFGSSTGRQRMVGWYDAVEKGDALRYGGFQDLVINKLDALTYDSSWCGGELLICIAYRKKNGDMINFVPRDENSRKELQPVYIQLPGWDNDLSSVRQYNDLPKNAKRYIANLYKSIIDIAYRYQSTPQLLPNLRYIGIGPNPSQIIKDVPNGKELLNSI